MTTIVNAVKNAVQDTHVVIINLAISSMSADRQVDMFDLGVSVDSLPKASKKLCEEKIFPKSFLRTYSYLREKAFAELGKGATVQLAMGTITSRSVAVQKIDALNLIKEEWVAALAADELTYDDMCQKHILELSQEAIKGGAEPSQVQLLTEMLLKRQPTWDRVKEKMDFAYSVTPVALDEKDFDPLLFAAQRDGIVALRDGVMGALVQYVVSEAIALTKVITNRNAGKAEYSINNRTAERVKGITEKLHGLTFIHKNIRPLAQAIDDAVMSMPVSANGKDLKLSSGNYQNLLVCLNAMSDQFILVGCLKNKTPLVQTQFINPTTTVQAVAVTSVAASVVPAVQPQATPVASGLVAQPVLPLTADEEEADMDAVTEAPVTTSAFKAPASFLTSNSFFS